MMPMLIDAGKRLLIDGLFLIVADAALILFDARHDWMEHEG
jgi:hypothetical protein